MKLTNYIRLILVLAVFLTADSVFSMANEIGNPNTSLLSENTSNDFLTIYKKNEKGLDVYTFTPEHKVDKETVVAIENRLKTVVEGFVSYTADKKNEVKIVTNPSEISSDDLEFVLQVVVKMYGNYSYTIEEL